jgi:tyrosyl-tRNA synthetase
LNVSDADAKTFIRIFTLFSRETIEKLEAEHDEAPHLRILQKELARDITIRVHSEAEYNKAVQSSGFLFGNTGIEFLNELNDDEIAGIFEGVPNFSVQVSAFTDSVNVIDLLAEHAAVFSSKGEAKKMIQGGGVAINKIKVTEADQLVSKEHLIRGKFLVVQKGKKNYFLITAL